MKGERFKILQEYQEVDPGIQAEIDQVYIPYEEARQKYLEIEKQYKTEHPVPPMSVSLDEFHVWNEAKKEYMSKNAPDLTPLREAWNPVVDRHHVMIDALAYNKNMTRLHRPTIIGFLVYSPVYPEKDWEGNSHERESQFEFMVAKMSDGTVNHYFIWDGLKKRNGNHKTPLPKYYSEIKAMIPVK